MPHRLKRASIARLTVGMAVLAFPLLATGVAQASIAGAAPASSSTVGPPDVVSATPLSASQVNVCFNKTIALNASSATGFALAGYRSRNSLQSTAANINSTNTNCAIVGFPTTQPGVGTYDINKFTVVLVGPGAVKSNSTGAATAVADSVTLTPATAQGVSSNDGTTGVTTAPNLVSINAPTAVQSPPTGNALTFNFDRNTHVLAAADFFFVTTSGHICEGNGFSGQDTTAITVTFTASIPMPPAICAVPPGPDSVTTAFRGGVTFGGVEAAYDPNSVNVNESTGVTGMTGAASQNPVLVAAVLNPANLDQVIFTFDRPIQLGPVPVFLAEFSNSQTIAGPGVQISPTQVAVSFGSVLSRQAEYGVVGWAPLGAVSSLGLAGAFNIPGSLPIGDNSGAVSNGFTTGADVFGVNINGGGTVTVRVDQRITAINTAAPASAGGISLLNSAGQVITGVQPSGAGLNTTGPGTYSFTLTYTPFQVTAATQVAFGTNAMTTPLTVSGAASTALTAPFTASVTSDAFSVPQIVASTATGGRLKAIKVAKKHTKAKKAHKKA